MPQQPPKQSSPHHLSLAPDPHPRANEQDPLLRTAILNNHAWCTAVLRAHGIDSRLDEHTWQSIAPVPMYYSNLVTRTDTPEGIVAQRAAIRALAAHPPKPRWSLKDSFAVFAANDLDALSMRPLFDAVWFISTPPHETDGIRETDLSFELVTEERALHQWEANWQYTSPAADRVTFPPSLLNDPDISFYAALRDGIIAGGLVLNCSPDAVGVSNVFSRDHDDLALLRDAIHALRPLHPDRYWVGYGPLATAHHIAPLGFRVLGPLRVWISRE